MAETAAKPMEKENDAIEAGEEQEVRLKSKDNKVLKAPLKAVLMSTLLKEMITDPDDDEEQEVPVPNVEYDVLVKIMEFCKHYQVEPMEEIEKPLKSNKMGELVKEWYANYIELEQNVLFPLMMGANYLHIQPLLDLSCAKVASMIKGKSPREIRETFNVENDFTPEEEKQIEEENKWCDEM